MSGSPVFIQRCPSCCRTLEINVMYLGLRVQCQHCGKQFLARDSESESASWDEPIDQWIVAADRVLTAEDLGRRPR